MPSISSMFVSSVKPVSPSIAVGGALLSFKSDGLLRAALVAVFFILRGAFVLLELTDAGFALPARDAALGEGGTNGLVNSVSSS